MKTNQHYCVCLCSFVLLVFVAECKIENEQTHALSRFKRQTYPPNPQIGPRPYLIGRTPTVVADPPPEESEESSSSESEEETTGKPIRKGLRKKKNKWDKKLRQAEKRTSKIDKRVERIQSRGRR